VVFEKGKSFNVIGSPLVWTRHNRNMINKIPKRMKVEHRTKLIEAISFCHQLKGRNALNKEKVPKRSVVVLKLSPRTSNDNPHFQEFKRAYESEHFRCGFIRELGPFQLYFGVPLSSKCSMPVSACARLQKIVRYKELAKKNDVNLEGELLLFVVIRHTKKDAESSVSKKAKTDDDDRRRKAITTTVTIQEEEGGNTECTPMTKNDESNDKNDADDIKLLEEAAPTNSTFAGAATIPKRRKRKSMSDLYEEKDCLVKKKETFAAAKETFSGLSSSSALSSKRSSNTISLVEEEDLPPTSPLRSPTLGNKMDQQQQPLLHSNPMLSTTTSTSNNITSSLSFSPSSTMMRVGIKRPLLIAKHTIYASDELKRDDMGVGEGEKESSSSSIHHPQVKGNDKARRSGSIQLLPNNSSSDIVSTSSYVNFDMVSSVKEDFWSPSNGWGECSANGWGDCDLEKSQQRSIIIRDGIPSTRTITTTVAASLPRQQQQQQHKQQHRSLPEKSNSNFQRQPRSRRSWRDDDNNIGPPRTSPKYNNHQHRQQSTARCRGEVKRDHEEAGCLDQEGDGGSTSLDDRSRRRGRRRSISSSKRNHDSPPPASREWRRSTRHGDRYRRNRTDEHNLL